MADDKIPVRRPNGLPALFDDVSSSADMLPAGNAWFGPQAGVLTRNKKLVDASTALLQSRAKQTDAYNSLIDARIRAARKRMEVLDLPNLLADDQREREHGRALSEQRRVRETLDAAHTLRMQLARHDLELAELRKQGVRAERNLEAARRVADVEIDKWAAQAWADRNEAEAVRQNTDSALRRTPETMPSPDALKAAMEDQLAAAIATLDNEIELAKARNNSAGVLALQNLKARLKAA